MALDGLFLYALAHELRQELVGFRVEKISQPTRQEVLLYFRSRSETKKLLLSASGNAPRLHLTAIKPENPDKPPMLTMLLRKNLVGAILTDIRQNRTDRVVFLDFNATNEIGDHVKRTLVVEIMAQYSNIILLDEDVKILDSVKRVDLLHSSVRQILPGLSYQLPPAQGKPSLIYDGSDKITAAFQQSEEKKPDKALLFASEGMSPALCREIIYRSGSGSPDAVFMILEQLKGCLENGAYIPCAVFDVDQKPIDFSFLELTQYQGMDVRFFPSLSTLLDEYYEQRERAERIKTKADDLFRAVNTLIERTARKINGQSNELKDAADREEKKIYGDLINANLYQLEKGSYYYDLPNFYDSMRLCRIPADPRLTPAQNAQKYYKEYRKAANAEKILTQQLEKNQADIDYLFSVRDALSRAETEKEFQAIRSELIDAGFLRRHESKNPKKKQPALPFLEYTSPNGFIVLSGRNNLQNDQLTFRTAAKNDIWFHVQKFHGSHVVLLTDGREPQPDDYVFAAKIAVENSEVSGEKRLPVDYTPVRYVKKPSGSKPGFVIYHVYKTMVV